MKKGHLIQVVLPIIFLLGVVYLLLNSNTYNLEFHKAHAEKEIAKIYSKLDEVSADENLDLTNLSVEQFDKIKSELPFDLFVFEDDKLIFWDENKAVLDLDIATLSDTARQISLKNGYYIALKKTKGNREYVALSLLRYSYNLVNKYLSNGFSKQFNFKDSDVILPSSLSKGIPIKDPNGKTIFRVLSKKDGKQKLNLFRLILSISIVLMFYVFVYLMQKTIEKKYGALQSLFFLIVVGIVFFYVLPFIPFEFFKHTLFSPKLYGAKILSSLGFLFLLSTYFLGVSRAIYLLVLEGKIKHCITSQIVLGITSVGLLLVLNIVLRSLVLDSIINFGAKNLSLLNPYAVFGLFVAFLLCLIFLYPMIAFLILIQQSKLNRIIIVAMSFCVGVILYLFNFHNISVGIAFLFFLFSFFVLLRLSFKGFFDLAFVIFMCAMFSVIQVSSVMREYTVLKKERLQETLASKKSRQRDVTAEDQFGKIAQKIQEDAFVRQFFQNPLISYQDIYKRMNFRYFGGYYSKYDVEVIPFNNEGKPIKTKTDESLESVYNTINEYGETSLSENLNFIQDKNNRFSYLSLLQIVDNQKVLGTLVLKISPKSYDIGNVYPELLLEGKTSLIKQYEEDFDYAIYFDNSLIEQSGSYVYVSKIDNNAPKKYVKNGYKHAVFSIDNHKKIIVSSKKDSFFDQLAIFSFVLCLYLIIIFIGILLYIILFTRKTDYFFNLTFKNRIVVAMVSLVFISFIGIGMATLSFFSDQYNSFYKNRLISKQNTIANSIKSILEKNKINSEKQMYNYFINSLNTDILEISDIHKMDLNVFSKEGRLIKSSQDGIFSSGLLSTIINPRAFLLLNNEKVSQVVQEENIGKLSYLSSYVPITNTQGEYLAFLNVPYFAKEKNLNQDISNFMISLINIYVLLLLIAIAVAFIVSNSITNPLREVGAKLKEITLTHKNEAIHWESDDEIGTLVKEYNKMIMELEQNAKLLAKSERDSAWREMAKQIAHEIKNPLTPMKLSIQHLQRALINDKERGAELAAKVSKTLIEQIDNLSDIATAFSSFAKMPKGDKVQVDLIEVVDSAADLFKSEKVHLIKNYQVQKAFILADKNKMISVFNNLIKNAKQATEDITDNRIEVSLIEQNNFFIVSIQDNGIGIPEDKKQKVFVPNFTTKSSGTGLGLAISKQIVESIDGDIWFESEYNVGTTFFVKLPKFEQ